MEDKLSGKTMMKFVGLRQKPIVYLIDNGSEDEKAIWKFYHQKKT